MFYVSFPYIFCVPLFIHASPILLCLTPGTPYVPEVVQVVEVAPAKVTTPGSTGEL